jgi:predicted transcriptional regulator
MRRRRAIVAAVLSLAVISAAALFSASSLLSSAPPRGAEGHEKGGTAELAEQAERTQLRIEAWEAAKAAGTVRVRRIASRAAVGWAGEQVIHPTANDWEPAIAADPNAPYVYMLVTRYTEPTACGNRCPLPYMMLRVSSDGGATWGPDRYICECRGVSGQYDPIIEVVPNTGHVYAVWMNGYNVVFSKSTDHGATWSAPVKTYGKVSWNDKPVLAMSDDGQHVYVSWNGPTSGDPWVAQSHNAGATWTQTKIVNGTRYYFAFDADVLPNGTVVFSEASISYTGPGAAPEGQVLYHAIRSTNQGASWQDVVVDALELGTPCEADGCYADYYYGHAVVSADANGNLVYLHDGAATAGGPQTVWSQTSADGGATWSARQALSAPGINSTFPAVESRGSGDVRAYYMQADNGHDAWNVWYRSSTSGGSTWSTPVKISDVTSGANYKTPSGFKEPYGDYGEMAITSTGKTIGIWGEGNSYTGPGGTWYNRQL